MTQTIVSVLPLVRLPRSRDVFDYAAPGSMDLGPGDLVQIQFRRRSCSGLVLKTLRRSSVPANKLLPVISLQARSFVPAPWLQTLLRTASANATSQATLASVAVPGLPRKFVCPPLPQARAETRRKLQSVEVVCGNAEERIRVAVPLLERALARKGQVLILVPDRSLVSVWTKSLALAGIRALEYTAEATSVQRRTSWLEVRRHKASVVVGTRVAAWLPFPALAGVIIDSPENENHLETEQEPKYDAVAVAECQALLSGASVAKLSPAPRLADWYKSTLHRSAWRTLLSDPDVNIIDMRGRRGAQLVSNELQGELRTALGSGRQSLLYLNRRGEANAVICRDCGHSPACGTCQRPFAFTSGQKLHCYHCGTSADLPPKCPVCRGVNVASVGAGLDALRKELAGLFPGTVIHTVEGAGGDRISAAPHAPFVIGSRALMRYLPFLKPALCALVMPDGELRLPEYAATERLWGTARQLTACADKSYVQTRLPEHALWQALSAPDGKAFYEYELEQRRIYQYPPFATLVRVTSQGGDANEVMRAAHLIASELRRQFGEQAQVVGPYPDYYVQKRGRLRWHVLAKLPPGTDISVLKSVLPTEARIDVNPPYVLS